MIAHGQQLSKADYPDLFEVIGYTYSTNKTGDTFNLPDLRNKFIRSATPHNDNTGTSITSDSEGNFVISPHNPGSVSNPSTNQAALGDHVHYLANFGPSNYSPRFTHDDVYNSNSGLAVNGDLGYNAYSFNYALTTFSISQQGEARLGASSAPVKNTDVVSKETDRKSVV